MGIFDLRLRALAVAFFVWLVPLIVSFGLYNPDTRVYLPNFAMFKLIMAGLAFLTTGLGYAWLKRSGPLGIATANTVLATSVVFDLILLVAIFGMPVSYWLLTVLPVYLLVFYGLLAFMRRSG